MPTVDSSPDTAQTSSGEKKSKAGLVSYIFLPALLAYVVVRSIAFSQARPVWFDEILTFAVASQPGLPDVWSAISKGFDAQPPIFYLFERMLLKLPVNADLALRLGSILTFPLLLVSVFLFIRKRTGELTAAVGVLAILGTSLFYMYSIEARGYSLVSACIAFAVVCYQRLASRRWAIGLGLSLFLAESFHYFAIFAVAPFAFAEAVQWLEKRRLRWFVWTALFSAALPLGICLPLVRHIKSFYGSHLLAEPEAALLPRYYASYFATGPAQGVALLLLSLAVVCWLFFAPRASGDRSGHEKIPAAEVALLFGLSVLPFIAYLGARLSHGQMLDRYTLPTIIGVVGLLAIGASRLNHRGSLVASLFIVALIAHREFQFWNHRTSPLTHPHSLNSKDQITAIQAFLERGGHSDLPIVINHPLIYCQLRYYAPRKFTDRLVAWSDQNRELRFYGTDSMFRAISGLANYFPVRLENYDEFMAKHAEFLFYSEFQEWSSEAVQHQAKSIRFAEAGLGRQLLLVRTRE